MNERELGRGDSFGNVRTCTKALQEVHSSHLAYDLVGKVAQSTVLTRRTRVSILKKLREDKLYMFRNKPEEFITKVIWLINEQIANTIVEHISYDRIDGKYDSGIFTAARSAHDFDIRLFAQAIFSGCDEVNLNPKRSCVQEIDITPLFKIGGDADG